MTAKYRAEYRKGEARRTSRADLARRSGSAAADGEIAPSHLWRWAWRQSARTRRARADAGDRWHGGSDHWRPRIFLRQAAQPSAGPRHVAESAVVTTSVKVSTAD